jgi:CBS-domain-containing membrane protein
MRPTNPQGPLKKLEEELELLEGFLRRLRLTWLLHHFPARPVWAAFVCINCFIAIALLSLVAMLSRSPLVFPSLGPTAYLLFFTPRMPAASPKHAICGHLIGILCGWLSLWLTGMLHAPGVMAEGMNLPRVLAAALSLGATGAIMVLLKVGHPPAGATTLIVSLGIITQIRHLVTIEIAVVALVLYALAMNRLSGIDYPWWAPRKHPVPLPRPPVE